MIIPYQKLFVHLQLYRVKCNCEMKCVMLVSSTGTRYTFIYEDGTQLIKERDGRILTEYV